MKTDKPIRDYERLVLRIPDGLRPALEKAAAIHGRSANAEAVAILTDALGQLDEGRLRMLRMDEERIKAERVHLSAMMNELTERWNTVRDEIAAIESRAGEGGTD